MAVGAATIKEAQAANVYTPYSMEELMKIKITINGNTVEVEVGTLRYIHGNQLIQIITETINALK